MTYRIPLSTLLAVIGAPAIADITADDVWANQNALYAATGFQISADRTRDGASVFFNDAVMTYALPMAIGEISVSMPPMTMVDETDGTVTIILPKSLDYTVTVKLPAVTDEPFFATMNVQQSDFHMTASGTPGAITYDGAAGPGTASLTTTLVLPENQTMGFGATVNGEGYTSRTTITEGAMITVTSDYDVAPLTYETITDADGSLSTNTASVGRTQASSSSAIPADGFDLLNLAPALRAGMFMRSTQSSEFTQAEQITTMDGQLFMGFDHSCGTATYAIDLSENGLAFTGQGGPCELTVRETPATQLAGLPGAIDLTIGGSNFDFVIPLLKTEAPQTLRYHAALAGIEISDNIWDMFDPLQVLSRDKTDVNIDLSAGLVFNVEWLDFLNVESEMMAQQYPVELNDLRVDAFDISAVGASLATSGAFTFDMANLVSFDGLPRPEGDAAIKVNGLNQLIDNLIAAGLIPEEQIMGPRMMIGMFAQTTGDDQLETALEVNGEGHVLVNGQRVK